MMNTTKKISNNKCVNPVAALFDLDGVLIDSETEYSKIWNEINRRYPTAYEDLAARIKGMTLDNILDTYFKDKSQHDAIRRDLHEMEGKMIYNWKPGAKELVEKLKNLGIPRVLVTSSDRKKMVHLKNELPELFPLMSNIVTAENISKSKPDPEGYLLGASLAGVSPSHCVVFEDSLQGVKAGKASGAFVIGVAGTLTRDVISPFSNLVIDSLEDINPDQLFSLKN